MTSQDTTLNVLGSHPLASGRKRRDTLYTVMTFGAVFYFIVYLSAYIARVHPPYGGVFTNTWMSGRAALIGNPVAWFDVQTYNVALRSVFSLPVTATLHNWSYPPHILLFTWVLGLLPYLPAWILWTITGYAAYFFTVTQGEYRIDRLVFLAAWPAGTVNYFSGENGFFTAALIISGLSMFEKRPIGAGTLFSLLTLKPQLGLLLPSMLLVRRNWRCIGAIAAMLVVLAALTMVIYGVDIWGAYFRIAVPAQNQIWKLFQRADIISMPTAFMNMRALGATASVAWLVQVPVSLAALAAVIWTFFKKRDPILSQALFVTASFLVTPYIFIYDMVVFGWVIAKLREHEDSSVVDDLIALSIWALPIIANPYPLEGIIALFVFPAILMARLLWRLHHDEVSAQSRKAQGQPTR